MPVFPSLLGVMELQPNSYEWKDLGTLTITWLQDAGGFAAIGLLFWMIYVLATPSPAVAGSRRQLITRFMAVTGIIALLVYLVAFGLTMVQNSEDQRFAEEQGIAKQAANQPIPTRPPGWIDDAQGYALALGGLFALCAFGEPFVLDLARLRWRRIYALAKLSFKEAVRRRVIWVFFSFLIVILFPASWFFFKWVKPEDMLKTTISAISYVITLLLILTALLLAAFSIPSDVKNLTIHTIVTKPVERFEIIVGRFLGYVFLETLALGALTAVSLLFILTSNVDEAAKKESMKARVPVYGTLNYFRERTEEQRLRSQQFEGVNVGREYEYRKYIAGGEKSSHRAIWAFSNRSELSNLADLPAVPLEFAFDIYRTTKGQENKGVGCSFDMVTWKWDQSRDLEYQKEFRQAFGSYPRNIKPDDDLLPAEKNREDWQKLNAIAEKYGRFEFKNYAIADYHTYRLMVPPGLLKNASEGDPPRDKGAPVPPRLLIKVKCEAESQLVGVAPLDLYLMESEGHFWINFFLAAIGLWCRLTIVIGLAIAASTYLAGVISFLLALAMFFLGYFQSFILSLATGGNVGGGPFESFSRLVKGSTTAAELDKTPTIQVLLFGDAIFRWLLRRFLNVIPDTERFTWSNYIMQGFSIPGDFIVLNLIFLAAYMLPWLVLAYYLMRSREIAA